MLRRFIISGVLCVFGLLIWSAALACQKVRRYAVEMRIFSEMKLTAGMAKHFRTDHDRYPTNLNDVAANGSQFMQEWARASIRNQYGDQYMIEPANDGVRIVITSGEALFLPRFAVSHLFTHDGTPVPPLATNPYGTARRVRRRAQIARRTSVGPTRGTGRTGWSR